MFNWFKKSVPAEKKVGSAAIEKAELISGSALSESVALKDQGNAHFGNNRLEEAIACYRRAIELNPRYAEVYNNLGFVLQFQNKLDEAVACYRKAIEYNPDLLQANRNLGLALLSLEQSDAAEISFLKVVELDPEHAEALQSLGVIAGQRGDFAQAETLLRRAIKLRPDYAEAHSNLGIVLQRVGQFDNAVASYRKALKIKPDLADAHSNLGFVLQELGQFHAAVASCHRALEIKSDLADAHCNLGLALQELWQIKAAEASYRKALKFKPDYVEANLNLGMLLLSLGRYAEAWPHYEYRYSSKLIKPSCEMPNLPYPQWQSESLVGKSLLIWPEQGFGDYIQFVRYAELLKDRGVSRLTLVCNQPLKALLETVAGVDDVITELPTIPYDYWIFPLSLPLHFATTLDNIPCAVPYLHALPERIEQWRDRLPKGLKVGLVWKGNPEHKNDANRSLPGLSTLAPLWSVPGVSLISLQKGQGEDEAKDSSADQPIIPLGSEIGDFADTAAILAQLDLVICVDTSIAHLAGAMGKPCWVLLPTVGLDWRWLRDREDSPWYPSVRLFRQKEAGKWDDPVERILQALIELARAV